MIQTRSLTKDFVVSRTETVHAVREIDLEVAPGELLAILGPNGAGKTTTMRMLTTLLAPTSGSASVAGFDVLTASGEVRRRIGYVGQGNGAGHTQRVRDELVSQGQIYGLSRARARSRAGELLEALDLTTLADRKVSDLSGGQRRRLDVAMGLVHAPRLLFLDEPSTGLDPQSRANLWEHILRMRAEHDMTIVLTTHYLDEADSKAERVVVVDHGQVIADDTAENLKTQLAGDLLTIAVRVPGRTDDVGPDRGRADADVARELGAAAATLPGARDVVVTATPSRTGAHGIAPSSGPGATVPDGSSELQVRVDHGPSALPTLLRATEATGFVVTSADLRRPTLDDVFLTLTGRSLREAGSLPPITTEQAPAGAGKDAA
ncbi:MAG: ATP-binding cassette domain-containing protein [Cellulomonadaceae bacterium]